MPQVWCLIFDKVKEPDDLSNSLLTSPQLWDDVLYPRKTDFLFSYILPILSARSSYLDKEDILNCRLVSPSWKTHVDNFLKNHPCLLSLDGINHEKKDDCIPVHSDSSYCWEKATVKVQSSADIHGILEKLLIYPDSNPFLIQCLEFGDFDWDPALTGEISPELLNDLKILLTRVGTSILHFRFLSAVQRTGPVFYKHIRELLQLLPNLKTLRFWFVAGPGDINAPQCGQLIQANPLPDLPHLQIVKASHLPTVIMNALLLKYSNQLVKLEMQSLRGLSHLYSYDKESINCSSKLNELSVRLWNLNDIWKLNSSGLLSGGLKSLNVFIDLSDDRDGLEKLFYVLSSCKAGAVLEILSMEILVDVYGPVKRLVDPQTRLRLPSLKKLNILCKMRALNTIDFILEMESLEELFVSMANIQAIRPAKSKVKEGYSPQLLKFMGYEEYLYESNIWELLPKLNQIQVTDEVLVEPKTGHYFLECHFSTRQQRHLQYNRATWAKTINET